MKHYSRLLLYIFLMVHFQASAQNFDLKNYKPLKSEGNIPKDFLSSFTEKYESGKSQVSEADKRKTKKTQDEFLKESNFHLNELLVSGKVLFGDPVTVYINKVADKLLSQYPELRAQLRLYTTKSPYVNAFCSDQGIIFVNVGLIAQLENEAQLAYILAHEIVHFVEKHNMELYVYSEGKRKGALVSRKSNYEEKMLSRSYRSKESEFESDQEGLEKYYAKSAYSLKSVKSVFDVLLYSYLPFDEVAFNKSFFETSCLKFPPSYLLDSVSQINAEKYLSEESATHPSIEQRRETILSLINALPVKESKEFLVSEEEFKEVRNICRFESLRLKMVAGNYIDALYDCFLLSSEFPDNRFVVVSTATCLYGLSRYKTEWKTAVKTSYKKVQGELQQMYYFIQKLSKKELNILALGYSWQAKQKYPDSEFLNLATDDLMADLVLANKVPYSFFLTALPNNDSLSNQEKNLDTTNLSKYDKIKQKKKKSGVDDDFLSFAFIDLLKDADFKSLYLKYDKLRTEIGDQEEDEKGLSKKEYRKIKKEKNKPCHENCIEQVVIANPFYLQYDSRNEGKVRFFKTETKKQDLISKIEKNAAKAELNINMLAPDKLTETDIEKWNDISFINEWFAERMDQDEIDLYPSETDIMQDVMSHYNASHLFWNGIISVRIKSPVNLASACMLLLVPYALPIYIYYFFKPYYQSYLFQVLYDTKNGNDLETNIYKSNAKLRPDLLNSRLFHSFIRIKRTKKS